MRKLLFLLPLVVTQAMAITTFDGKYKAPNDAKDLCVEYEQSLVRTNRRMVETNGKAFATEDQQERQRLFAITKGHEDFIEKQEISWSRMNCASILYPRK